MFIETEQGTLIGPNGYQGMITRPYLVMVTTLGERSNKFIQVELASFDYGKTLKLYRHIAAKSDQLEWDEEQERFAKPTDVSCRLALFMDRLHHPDRTFWNFAAVELREGLWLPTDETWRPR